ncbi:MAG: phosphoribosylanthranilate isomerase [Candidatus Bathyarchaeota archaeon]|nr:phosphoribosylanthranilate isomerase [Candidatus Bathyarchaeota archaeon]
MIKICGITRSEDIKAAVNAGVNSLGFVVRTPSSLRNLNLAKAKNLISEVPRNVSRVAVTVSSDSKELEEIYRELNIDFLQLHGRMDLATLRDLSSKINIIKAINATSKDSSELANIYASIAKAVLLDSTREDGTGGTGVVHSWDRSRKIRNSIHPAHMILAGGLTPENVVNAISKVEPYGVDVASGVEEKPGIKDHERMLEFITKAKEVGL